MNEINFTGLFFQTMKKKIIYIFILGILAGVLIGGLKFLFSDTATREGDYYFNQTIQVNSSVPNDNFNYSAYLNSAVNYHQFVQKMEEDGFDFTKLDSAWNRKTQADRLKWLQQHIKIASFGSGVFRVSIRFDANITHDVDYMKEYGDKMIGNFVGQSEEYIHKVKTDATFQPVESEQSYPEVKPINRKNIMIKFGAAGVVAGIFISAVAFYLLELRRQNKKMLQDKSEER